MGEYALLTEVYGSTFKPKKTKKLKKKEKKEERNRIIEPNEMDRVLLDEQSTSPEVKIRNLSIDSYDEQNESYEEYFKNPNVQRYDEPISSIYQRNIVSNNPLKDDPEYQEFLEYKRNKRLETEMNKIETERKIKPSFQYSHNDQLNELMLYIFTGFFFLMLFDNIYKLGKKSY